MITTIESVFAVRESSEQIGRGKIHSIFSNVNAARRHAKECGVLDCDGAGLVEPRRAIQDEYGMYHLLSDQGPFILDQMSIDKIKPIDSEHPAAGNFQWKAKIVNQTKRAAKLIVLGKAAKMSLRSCTELLDGIESGWDDEAVLAYLNKVKDGKK